MELGYERKRELEDNLGPEQLKRQSCHTDTGKTARGLGVGTGNENQEFHLNVKYLRNFDIDL